MSDSLFNWTLLIEQGNLHGFDKTKFRFMCISEDHLYVSDLGRSIVYKTSLQGDMELAFGHFGKAKGQMNEPSGIHVDGDGKAILVADSKNNRLQVCALLPYFFVGKLFN